jgi:hypothetical protein
VTDPAPQDPSDELFDRLHDDSGADDDRVEQPADPAASASELDELRIRQIATLRRALYRSRSHAIVVTIALLVVAVQLGWMTYSSHRRGSPKVAVALAIAGAACLAGSLHFWRRAAALHQEAKRTLLIEPAQPPDFSTLSDGSQQWKNLEELR